MNPYETLGMEPRLALEGEELNKAFREAGKSIHPDAGGSEEDFARLQNALATLRSPARRLKVWLELKGIEVESRGSIGNELMDEFGRVGEATQKAEAVIRKREGAQSALAKAMLESETQLCREKLEQCMRRLEIVIDGITDGFAVIDETDELDSAAVVQWHRDLTFLEKWQVGLRSLFSKLL